MKKLILKRLINFIPLLLGITFMTFMFIHLAPGNFLDTLKLNPQISPQTIHLYESKFNLDKPFLVQYFSWLINLLKGDWGYSFAYKAPVIKIIASRAFNTFILSLSALIFTWLIVLPLGTLGALKKNRFIDKVISFISYLGISLPTFFLAFLLLYFATFGSWLPLGGMRSINYDEMAWWQRFFDLARHLVIPTLVLAIGNICILSQILKSNLLEAMGSAYVLGAKARGITSFRIIYIHCLKNSLNPMITIFGYQFSALLSGAALTEIILGWPGLGQVSLAAVMAQDLYLIMGTILMSSVFLVVGNLLADILLAYADPRIQVE